MPEEDWAEVVQGVPAKDETFIKQYLGGREALIAQEQKQRSGKQIPPPRLSLRLGTLSRPSFLALWNTHPQEFN